MEHRLPFRGQGRSPAKSNGCGHRQPIQLLPVCYGSGSGHRTQAPPSSKHHRVHCTALHSPLFVLPVISVHCMLPLGGGTRLQLSGPNTGQDCVFGPSRRGCVYFLLVKNVSSKQYHFWRKSFLFRDPFRRFLLSARKFSKCQRLS